MSNLQSLECRRGTLALFKTCYSIRSLCLPGNSQFVESVWFDLCDDSGGVITRVGCIYRSPSASDCQETERTIATMLHKATMNYTGNLFIAGDFNFPDLIWKDGYPYIPVLTNRSRSTNLFTDCLHDLNLYQIVEQATRGRLFQRPTLLDLVFLRDKDQLQNINYLPPLGKSDHIILEVNVSFRKIKNDYIKKTYVDYGAIRKELEGVVWSPLLQGDVDQQWANLKDELLTLQKKHTSVKLTPKPKTLPFMTPEIRKERNRRGRYWRKYNKGGKEEHYQKFAKARNKLRSLTKQLYARYESKLADDSKNNPKKFWKYVSSKDHSRRSVKALSTDDSKEVTNLKDITKLLNRQFASVFTNEPDGPLPHSPPYDIPNPMPPILLSPPVVQKRLEALDVNKSAGPDNLHPRLLKELAKEIAQPLCNIFQLSLDSKKVPKDWKLTHVTPIFKKGDRTKAKNYRPISLTSAVAKTLERIVNADILTHLCNNNILSPDQHGFLPGKSVETNLLETYSTITDHLEKGIPVDLILLDLAKAFDKVPHNRLRLKLSAAGTHSDVVDWVMDFLTGRSQQVRLFTTNGDKVFSEPCDVVSGVPQGTVLGPTLFLIYINDMMNGTENNITLYADDSKLFGPANQQSLQRDLHKIQMWAQDWLLEFNTSKCSVLHFGSNNLRHQYSMSDPNSLASLVLKTSPEERDLGVLIDEQLKFHGHWQQAVSKANSSLGLLKRTITSRSRTVFLRLYKAIVRPVLDFGTCLTSPSYKNDTSLIEGVQRRATKCIAGLRDLPYNKRLERMQLPTLVFRRRRGDMMLTYKYNAQPNNPLFTKHSSQHHTRGHSHKLSKRFVKTRTRQHFFSERVVNDWNSLQAETATAPTAASFKSRLDKEWNNKPWKYEWDCPSHSTTD